MPVDAGADTAAGDAGQDAPISSDGGADAADAPDDAPGCESIVPTPATDPGVGAFVPGYGHPGVGGGISWVGAIATSGEALYLGGRFESAGDRTASNVARWTVAEGFVPLGDGLPTPVSALAAGGTTVYAAHQADLSGPEARISAWDGSAWSTLADADGVITDLELVGDVLWVAGDFAAIDGVAALRVAYFDGAWHDAGAAPDAMVSAISATGPADVCIGGSFGQLGAAVARRVACWDGASWSARDLPDVGTPVVLDLTRDGTELVAAGSFLLDAADPGGSIARWTGDRWALIGGGVMGFGPGDAASVSGVAVTAAGIYVGGGFQSVGADRAEPIASHGTAAFDGTTWRDLGGAYYEGGIGFGGGVGVVAAGPDGSVYFGGQITRAGSLAVGHVVRWDGAYFVGLTTPSERYHGVGGTVSELLAIGSCGALVGGSFSYAGGIRAESIARYDREAGFSALGEGLLGAVSAIALGDGETVYAGGNFTDASGFGIANLASWNGVAWEGVGTGTDAPVAALAFHEGVLYVGGELHELNGERITAFAAWDGTTVADLGRGMLGHPYPGSTERAPARVEAITIDPATGDVVIAGSFESVGDPPVPATNVARWDGAAWHAYGEGLGQASEWPTSLAWLDGELVAGGSFLGSGATSLHGVARWSGSAWEQLGAAAPDGFVVAMATSGDALYVAGNLQLEGVQVHAAVWDGSTWRALGGGLSDAAESIAVVPGGVLVGGTFTGAGEVRAAHLAFFEHE